MTWVIGATTIFGQAVLIGDIRVTFADGSSRDMLKKLHLVGQTIGMGFSGSVKIGFMLMDDLIARLRLSHEEAQIAGWHPVKVGRWWMSEAAQIFHDADPIERRLGSTVLLAGVSPTENLGDAPFPRPFLVRLKAPDFKPGIVPLRTPVCHIGSGSKVASYKRHLKTLVRPMPDNFHLQMLVANPSAWAWTVANDIGEMIASEPARGVSKYCHVLVCGRRQWNEGKNDFGWWDKDGLHEVKMPDVASSYPEFQTRCADAGWIAAGATASLQPASTPPQHSPASPGHSQPHLTINQLGIERLRWASN